MSDGEELTADRLVALTLALEQRRTELQRALEATRDDSRPVELELSIGRLTRMDAMQQQQMAAALRQRLETQLAQVQRALGKLADGSYGQCASCEEPIGMARLLVKPEAPFCVPCQEAR